jgi:hypothetical protein
MREASRTLKGLAQPDSIQGQGASGMQRIREVLLNEYIGAITIGFILAQAVAGIISAVVQPIAFYWTSRQKSSIFDRAAFPWDHLILSLVSAALYFLAAYLLLRWLYFQPSGQTVENASADHAPTPTDGSNES